MVKWDHTGLLLRNSWFESMWVSQVQRSSRAEHPPDKRKVPGADPGAGTTLFKGKSCIPPPCTRAGGETPPLPDQRDEGEEDELPALEAGEKQVQVLSSRPINGCLAHVGEHRSE